MTDTVVAALLAALVWKFTDFLKHVAARDVSAVVTQLVAWSAGVVAVVLFAHSAYAAHAVVDALRLSSASFVDQLLAGMLIGSGASTAYDVKRAIDNGDTASTPPLIDGNGSPSAPPPAAGHLEGA